MNRVPRPSSTEAMSANTSSCFRSRLCLVLLTCTHKRRGSQHRMAHSIAWDLLDTTEGGRWVHVAAAAALLRRQRQRPVKDEKHARGKSYSADLQDLGYWRVCACFHAAMQPSSTAAHLIQKKRASKECAPCQKHCGKRRVQLLGNWCTQWCPLLCHG